MSNTY